MSGSGEEISWSWNEGELIIYILTFRPTAGQIVAEGDNLNFLNSLTSRILVRNMESKGIKVWSTILPETFPVRFRGGLGYDVKYNMCYALCSQKMQNNNKCSTVGRSVTNKSDLAIGGFQHEAMSSQAKSA